MNRNFLAIGSATLLIAVALGALGAHLLQSLVENNTIEGAQLESYKTGIRYQLIHGLALFGIGISGFKLNKLQRLGAHFFWIGTLLFSVSIYLLSLYQPLGIASWKSVLGPITPLGGLLLIAGWALFLISAIIKSNNDK